MDKGGLLYEGKAKKIYATTIQEHVLVKFKDDATGRIFLLKIMKKPGKFYITKIISVKID